MDEVASPPPGAAFKVSETVRERETFRYDYALIAQSVANDAADPIPRERLQACSDAGLTALTQLGAFKLGATAGLLSLLDRSRQHFVAEAGRELPLKKRDGPCLPLLRLCGTSIVRSPVNICEQLVDCHASPDDETPLLVVPDLATDDRFARWPLAEYCRFYAGVPIRSSRGIVIGVYAVVDEQPRPAGLRPDEAQFMRDMASVVMVYMERKKATDGYRRVDRMVRGLGSFVEGKATLTSDTSAANFSNETKTQEGQLNVRQTALNHRMAANPSPLRRPSLLSSHSRHTVPLVRVHPSTSTSVSGTASSGDSPFPITILSGESAGSKTSSVTAPDLTMVEVRQAFSKAANLIRESVEVEGVLFLDASIGSFGGLVGGHTDADDESPESRSYSSSSSSEDFTPAKTAFNRTCEVFGFSTSDISSIDGDAARAVHSTVPEALLKKLLRRYPNGKIFNFDEDGAAQSGDSEVDEAIMSEIRRSMSSDASARSDMPAPRKSLRKLHSRANEAREIISVFAGARSIALVPIWDSNKERWYSGGFVWTHTPGRHLTVEGELSYLTAFGTTIMAEVTRIDAMVSEKAKSDVLGSLSHELRSPLHGVIASVDLLHDTKIDAFQGDVIHTIETSGRTLLDTLDHMLDYSKINSFLRPSAIRRRNDGRGKGLLKRGERSIESGMMALTSDARLDLLVEEVVESVYAGYNFQRMSVAQVTGRSSRHADTSAMRLMDSIVAGETFGHEMDTTGNIQLTATFAYVHLDIDPGVAWGFRTQPGALRRIVMNLFGNSLKYTTRGYIWVSLRQAELRGRHTTSGARVVITVSDTGKGIGEEYLRSQLFTPFSQEDRLAPGTGLGLSLVRQIAANLGGSVTVTSKVGRGTSVRVSLPMTHSQKPVDSEVEFSDRVAKLQGLRVCLRGFEGSFDRVGGEYLDESAGVSEEVLMETLCNTWLGMHVISETEAETELPDVFLYSERAFVSLDSDKIVARSTAPMVIVCRDAVTAHNLAYRARHSGICEFISQPTGPRKLAKALALGLIRWKDAGATGQKRSRSSPSPSSSPSPRPSPHGVEEAKGPADSAKAPVVEALPAGLSMTAAETAPPPPTSTDVMDYASPEALGKLPERMDMDNVDSPTPASQPQAFLLVDDNAVNLRILSTFLRRLGYDHDTAVNGLEALQAYTENLGRYSCVFMDISMPVMDGLESTRMIRELERKSHVKPATIVALTGLASASIRQEAFATGIDLFLTKPVKLKELKQIVDGVLEEEKKDQDAAT